MTSAEPTPALSTGVSVIMPVRGGGPTVKTAAVSVLAELGPDDELIVVDDGLDPRAQNDLAGLPTQVRIVPSAGSGIVDALNTGLRAAGGAYIARCDADDQWLPGKLNAQLSRLVAEPEAVACFGPAVHVDASGRRIGDVTFVGSAREVRRAMTRTNVLVHGAVLARASAIEKVGGYRQSAGTEDYDLWMRLLRVGEIVFVDEPVYVYTLSEAGAYRRKRRTQARSSVRIQLSHFARTGRLSPVGLSKNVARSLAPLGRRAKA